MGSSEYSPIVQRNSYLASLLGGGARRLFSLAPYGRWALPMNILFATLELAPYVETSPAAQAVSSLAKALRLLGTDVTVVAPRLPAYEESGLMAARQLSPLSLSDGREATVYEAQLPSGVKLCLIEVDGLGFSTERPLAEQAAALGAFAAATAALVRKNIEQGSPFEVLHAHDAGAGLSLESLAAVDGKELARLLTVHDASQAGEFARGDALALGLATDRLGAEGFGTEGLVGDADLIVTPSESYARSLKAPEKFGALSRSFQGAEVVGVVEGVDHAVFNPSTDAALNYRYDAPNPSNKGRNKSILLTELGLELELSRPVIFCEDVHGFDSAMATVLAALPSLIRNDVTLILSGTEEGAKEAAELISPFSGQVAWVVTPPARQRRRLLAASDFYLCVQRRNPSGQALMQAARYGAVPMALRADAAMDIVVDLDGELRTGTGILFDAMTQRGVVTASARAVSAYRSPLWTKLLSRVMRQDLAWDRSARRHLQLYRRVRSAQD
jgi:starch synthase